MTAPNLRSVTTINGKTAQLAVTTSATAIVSNAAASGKCLKVVSLYVANIDGTNNADITVDLYRSSVAYKIANTMTVPADSTITIIGKEAPIYLEEGDSLRLTASADSDLQGLCSYEDIS